MSTTPRLLTDLELHTLLLDVSYGAPLEWAAQHAGCTLDDVEYHRSQDPDFDRSTDMKTFDLEIRALANINHACQDPKFWRASAWALAVKHPEQFDLQFIKQQEKAARRQHHPPERDWDRWPEFEEDPEEEAESQESGEPEQSVEPEPQLGRSGLALTTPASPSSAAPAVELESRLQPESSSSSGPCSTGILPVESPLESRLQPVPAPASPSSAAPAVELESRLQPESSSSSGPCSTGILPVESPLESRLQPAVVESPTAPLHPCPPTESPTPPLPPSPAPSLPPLAEDPPPILVSHHQPHYDPDQYSYGRIFKPPAGIDPHSDEWYSQLQIQPEATLARQRLDKKRAEQARLGQLDELRASQERERQIREHFERIRRPARVG